MDLSLLATLKSKMRHAKNLGDILDYFLTHFGMDDEFIKLGERVESEFLEAIVREIGKAYFKKEVVIQELLLTRLPEHGFIHSGGLVNGKVINLLYFEDIQTGLLSMAWSTSPGETKLARFSGRAMAKRHEPSAN